MGVGGVARSEVGAGRGSAAGRRRRRGPGQGLEEVERGAALVGDGGLAALEREALPLRLGEEHRLRRLRQRVGRALHRGGAGAARGGRRVCACGADDGLGEQGRSVAIHLWSYRLAPVWAVFIRAGRRHRHRRRHGPDFALETEMRIGLA